MVLERRTQNAERRSEKTPFLTSTFCVLRSAFKNPQGRRSLESGYTLAALIVLVTIIAVIIAYTVPPHWSNIMQRQRELQTIWVMKQYARAIQEFQRKRGTFPVSLEQLEEQNTPRVLRRLYPNPLTGEVDWVLVPFGTASPAQQAGQPGQPGQPPGYDPWRLVGGRRPDTGQPGQPNQPEQPGQPTPAPPAPAPGPGGQVGPFIGVRLPISGESIVPLNGSFSYEEWMYTVNELQRDQALAAGPAGQPGGPAGPGTPGQPPQPTPPPNP